MSSVSSNDSYGYSDSSFSTDTEQQIGYMLDQFVKEEHFVTPTLPSTTTDDNTISTPPPQPASKIPDQLESRLKRVSKEPIRILSSKMTNYENGHEFKVRGSTGKTYIVTIGPKLDCTCYDHKIRSVHCKHILYVLLKELKVQDLTSTIYITQFPSSDSVLGPYHMAV
ncbi:hypothetical protein A0J61_02630 [Choanephora cucurbitarum]|uniref:SWIM-type domain-containing protein n=1 Tax=Choanephora cucurbitarum TaxID=101091 RepID=A0A1C7NK00_9FUNG|nr:hypothetical protein A0J61_02630 [Choanephora cucurbitarum]